MVNLQQLIAYRLKVKGVSFGKGAIRYSRPEQIDFNVVESMLRATAKSEGKVCWGLALRTPASEETCPPFLFGKAVGVTLMAPSSGDEFVIMLVHADRNRATSIAERIRDMVERNAIAFGSHVLRICVSVGVTTVEPADTDAGMTLRRGDAALYLAKQQGRNRVVCA